MWSEVGNPCSAAAYKVSVEEMKAAAAYEVSVEELKAAAAYRVRVEELKAAAAYRVRVEELATAAAKQDAQAGVWEVSVCRKRFSVGRRPGKKVGTRSASRRTCAGIGVGSGHSAVINLCDRSSFLAGASSSAGVTSSAGVSSSAKGVTSSLESHIPMWWPDNNLPGILEV